MKTFNFLLTLFLAMTTTYIFADDAGFAKFSVGVIDIYSIQDTSNSMANSLFPDASDEMLARHTRDGKSPSSISAFVIRKGAKTILVDTGNGNKLLENLAAAGIKTADVSDILLTHTHSDHINGLFTNSKRNFPNASVWLTQKELNFWNQTNKNFLEKAIKSYGELKIIVPDEKTTIVLPEIVAIDAVGHTPGHVVFLVSSKKAGGGDVEKVFIAGDLLHSADLQFPHPEISSVYDRDKKGAADVRKKLLLRAVKEDWFFVSAHVPFPGFYKLEINGNGFSPKKIAAPQKTTNDLNKIAEQTSQSFFDFTVTDIDGKEFNLKKLKGKKIMVVNVASKCGLTPQYEDLQKLYEAKRNDNFVIVAFPANNFGKQEPGTNEEIKQFCQTKYSVTFPVMAKISVTGDDIHPLYRWLTEKKYNGKADAPVQWNFQKFIIDEEGNWIKSIPPKTKPTAEDL
ncbi:MAG: MBL fold metallo-hydrolase [Planctomycetaceae bacterium]|jgi:glutathione peroxidase|nr:MBL fold metallo-hydrolase [Planctomycetaceae bacterium]